MTEQRDLVPLPPERHVEVMEARALQTEVLPAENPAQRLKMAVELANTLAPVIEQRKLFSTISGRRYVLFEGWSVLGALLPGTQVFPHTVWCRPIGDTLAPVGFEARVEARTIDGRVLSVAEARCTRSERNWKDRDDFALESMAQTRAGAKALRMPLGFIMKLAGFEATPAEEMDGGHAPEPDDAFERGAAKARATKPVPVPATATAAAKPAQITEAQARRIVAVAREAGEKHNEHGFHVVSSVLKECDLKPIPPKSKMDDCLLHLCDVVEPGEYDTFVAMVQGWQPK